MPLQSYDVLKRNLLSHHVDNTSDKSVMKAWEDLDKVFKEQRDFCDQTSEVIAHVHTYLMVACTV